MIHDHIKSIDDYYAEKNRLEQIVRAGNQARAELDALDHKYGWAIFSEKGVISGLDKLSKV